MASTLCIVGGGNMGTALLGGLIDSGWATADCLCVVEVAAGQRAELTERFPTVHVCDEMVPCDDVVIAVKPDHARAATSTAVAAGARRLLSIAAGVTIGALQDAAGDDVAIVRAMPNTPALVRRGVAAIAGGPTATDDDMAWAEGILTAVGTVVRLDEAHLDAVTGLAGSGPAYIFLIAEALIDAGVLNGLTRPDADKMVTQLLVGSAALLAERGDPAALRAAVTSPGGTTAAGLRVLEEHAVRSALMEAVSAATARSRELGSA